MLFCWGRFSPGRKETGRKGDFPVVIQSKHVSSFICFLLRDLPAGSSIWALLRTCSQVFVSREVNPLLLVEGRGVGGRGGRGFPFGFVLCCLCQGAAVCCGGFSALRVPCSIHVWLEPFIAKVGEVVLIGMGPEMAGPAHRACQCAAVCGTSKAFPASEIKG